jgi:aminoglycoside 6'-N-acetyltransferase
LVSERLLLRPLRPDDAEALAGYRSDPDVARFQSWTAPYSAQDALRLIEELVTQDPQEPGWFQYGLERRDNGSLIGDLGVNLQENRMQAEIGFTVAAGLQRRGFGGEAVRRMLDHLFIDQGLHRVSAECDARNTASARLMESLGFRREGCRRAHTWIKGEWTDDLLFGLLADEWSPT